MRRKKYLKENANFYFEDDDFWKFDDVSTGGDEVDDKDDEWMEDIWGDSWKEDNLGESEIDLLLRDLKSKAAPIGFEKKVRSGGNFPSKSGDNEDDEVKALKNWRNILKVELPKAFTEWHASNKYKLDIARFYLNLIEDISKSRFTGSQLERYLSATNLRAKIRELINNAAKEAFGEID
jgi:hypothetical protein